jgi:hypothetical protein
MKRDNADTAFIAVLIMFMMSIVFFILLLLSTVSHAAMADDGMPEVSVCWDAPTQRIDGTPLNAPELAKYQVEHYYGITATVHDVPSADTTFNAMLAGYGQNCFRVRVFDTNGLSSVWTEQVCMTVLAPPSMIKFRQCS